MQLDGRVVTSEDKVRAINALDFPGHERGARARAWARAFDPSGEEAAAAVAEADGGCTHDRREFVELEVCLPPPPLPPSC